MRFILVLFKSSLFIFMLLIYSCSSDSDSSTTPENPENTQNVTANKQQTGSSSNDLLSADTFQSILLEVVFVQGFEPTETALTNLKEFLNEVTNKPNGITIEKRAIASPSTAPYSIEEIIAIEDENRMHYNTANQIAVWAFFADGESANNTSSSFILGTAYRNTSFVIYENTIRDNSNSAFEPSRSVLETTVINHEFGHILGLTNLGAPLQSDHEDADHSKHCNVDNCLMFWSAETGSGLENLVGANSAPQLDAQCRADLRANGGK